MGRRKLDTQEEVNMDFAQFMGEIRTELKNINDKIDGIRVKCKSEDTILQSYNDRLASVEKFQDRQKWYIAGMAAILTAIIFLIDKGLDWWQKLRS